MDINEILKISEKDGLNRINLEGQLSNITTLDLKNSELTELPPEIGSLKNLISLDLGDNKISALPPEIGLLTNLAYLNLGNNKISTLPPEIGNLTKLTSLNLFYNQLMKLPPEIGHLANLSFLDLSANQITSLPAEIGNLTNLTYLNFSGNQITDLPLTIGQLTKLESFDFHANPISRLPKQIIHLVRIRYVNDGNTHLPPRPPEINEAADILSYYSYYYKRPLNECKLIVVGQGSVGKTSLVRRLFNGKFDAGERKTDGIEINRWEVMSKSSRKETNNSQLTQRADQIKNETAKIILNIWDFGGQEIMHATHQFFLTKRSIYILVLDARLTQDENRVEYWLKIIQSFGGMSPVIIVGNKTDQHPFDIDRTGLQKKYPNVVNILETSAATGAGIAALKAAIAARVNDLPHVRDQVPEQWFNIKTRLEELRNGQNFITRDAYLELCDDCDVPDTTSQNTLISFLHDLGVVLHFQDDPRLEELGILNPLWVTNGVYKILNSHALFQKKGVLTLDMLDSILDLPEYPRSKRLFIVDMMKKFDLCYDIDSDKTFLVPDLLPKDEPFLGEWDSALAFQYHYDVLPSSVITRFIVRMNTFIYKTVWRSGVVLQKRNNTALVKADAEDRKIYIWVNGNEPTRRDFLSSICTEFESIHKTLAKIEAAEKVPHPRYPKIVIDYDELLQFERDGITEFPKSFGGQTILVNVQQLLNGVFAPGTPQREVIEYHLHSPEPDSTPPPTVKKFKIFITIPNAIGRFVFDVLGRDKATDGSANILGYVIIIFTLVIPIAIRVIGPGTFVNLFTFGWRFFFPLK